MFWRKEKKQPEITAEGSEDSPVIAMRGICSYAHYTHIRKSIEPCMKEKYGDDGYKIVHRNLVLND